MERAHEEPKDGESEGPIPPDLVSGQAVRVQAIEARGKKTKAPSRLTEASLLRAMETAGKSLDDEDLERAMGDGGLGTPATRASMIEKLIARRYVERRGKYVEPTELGASLIQALAGHEALTSAEMTARWELALDRVAQRAMPPEPSMPTTWESSRER